MFYLCKHFCKCKKILGILESNIGLAKIFVWLMNTLFNKVLGENEKCLLFLLKTE